MIQEDDEKLPWYIIKPDVSVADEVAGTSPSIVAHVHMYMAQTRRPFSLTFCVCKIYSLVRHRRAGE